MLQFVARLEVQEVPLSSPGSSQVFLRAVREGRGGAEKPVMQTKVRHVPASAFSALHTSDVGSCRGGVVLYPRWSDQALCRKGCLQM